MIFRMNLSPTGKVNERENPSCLLSTWNRTKVEGHDSSSGYTAQSTTILSRMEHLAVMGPFMGGTFPQSNEKTHYDRESQRVSRTLLTAV